MFYIIYINCTFTIQTTDKKVVVEMIVRKAEPKDADRIKRLKQKS